MHVTRIYSAALLRETLKQSISAGAHLWVHHRAASSQVVGCGASRGGHYQAVPLHMDHKVAVAEALQVTQERRDAAIYDHLIEHHLLI